MSDKLVIYRHTGTYYETTPITFNDAEVQTSELTIPDLMEIQEAQRQLPRLIDISKLSSASGTAVPYQLNVQIQNVSEDYHGTNGTLTKIDLLYAAKQKLKVYYKYAEDATAYLEMLLDPNRNTHIEYGYYDVFTFNLIFYGEV